VCISTAQCIPVYGFKKKTKTGAAHPPYFEKKFPKNPFLLVELSKRKERKTYIGVTKNETTHTRLKKKKWGEYRDKRIFFRDGLFLLVSGVFQHFYTGLGRGLR